MPLNPFKIRGVEDLSDEALKDQIQIYRDLRERLREAADSILSVFGQVDEALGVLEDEVRRRDSAP